MFVPHPSAAVEYWFFKVNAGPIALIVDWLERRRAREHVLRASVHSSHGRNVVFEQLTSFMPKDNFLTTQKSVGHAGDISWELDIHPGPEWIQPDIFPATLLRMTDLTLVSAPLARFSGWIQHGSQRISFNDLPGLLSQYWGRQLNLEWWWISAHQFDKEGIVIECVEARSRLWGTSLQMPLGYIYLHNQGRSNLWVAPIHPLHVQGSPEKFQIDMDRRGTNRISLLGTGRDYCDFGERIMNTLTGDLEIHIGDRLLARANGTAALERRTPA